METTSTPLGSVENHLDDQATALTRARYQRISPIYDQLETLLEGMFRPWRKILWQSVRGPDVLEVGVGTGKNMYFWRTDLRITAIDLTAGMLDVARKRLQKLNLKADLRLGDAQALEFPSASFDSAVAAFVFCSVPTPVLGLRELGRVVRPGGQILLLEHIRVDRPIIGTMMDLLAPVIVRVYGASINRRTIENVRLAGLHVENVEHLDDMGMFKLIAARPNA